jgi:hypothetical protein
LVHPTRNRKFLQTSKPAAQEHEKQKEARNENTLLFPITSAALTHTPRKKNTHTHAPKSLPAQSTRTRTKNKRESNNKSEIKTEENYLLYAQTEKEDCSSVSVSVYCSHNAQREKQEEKENKLSP